MGSHDFSITVYRLGAAGGGYDESHHFSEDAQAMYETLCREALHEHGHDPYNGTISTTHSVRVVPTAKPLTLTEASAIANERLDTLSKWDACEAIRLVGETPPRYERTGTRTVQAKVPWSTWADAEKRAAHFARLLKVKVDSLEQVQYSTHRGAGAPRTTWRVNAHAPKEPAQTRYFALRPGAAMPPWESGHPTQAAARAAIAPSEHALPHFGGEVRAEVVAITRRASGAPLVSAHVAPQAIEAEFEVTLRRLVAPATQGTKHDGWLFYGWAAS